MRSAIRIAVPLALGAFVLALWEVLVRHYEVPVYVLPAPSAIWPGFTQNAGELMAALWTTLKVTWLAFGFAFVSAMLLAVVFNLSRTVEMDFFLAPDLRRLANFFVFDRPAAGSSRPPLFSTARAVSISAWP